LTAGSSGMSCCCSSIKLICPFQLSLLQKARDLGRHAAGGGNQALGVLGQHIVIDARVVVEALQLGNAGDLQQVLIASFVLSQQQQVGGLLIFLRVVLLDGTGCHVGLQPDDRLNPRLGGGVVELDHPEHGAMVGDGDGGHVHLVCTLNQLVDVAETIKQGVFGVNVKMDKCHGLGGKDYSTQNKNQNPTIVLKYSGGYVKEFNRGGAKAIAMSL
jgi:hypothetical protein